MKVVISVIISMYIHFAYGQVLYIPSGASGIGPSLNGSIGVGTNNPLAKVEIVGDNNILRLRGTQFATSTPLDIVNLGLQGLTGAMNITVRTGYPYGGGVNSGPRLDVLKINNGNTILSTSENGTTLGKVGVGTTNPQTQLDVVGSGPNNGLRVRNTNEIADWGISIQQYDDLRGSIVCAGRDLQIEAGWTNSLILGSVQMGQNGGKVLFPGGNIGIGTSNPTQKLTVKGTVYSTEVKVDIAAGAGPDYVFEPTYTLPSLDSVQSYINQNKHLPEVPSAKEMEAHGVNIGEMNMLLLKKVEELTLYVIELKKQNERQQQEINAIKSKEN